jgi:hypothetical protein
MWSGRCSKCVDCTKTKNIEASSSQKIIPLIKTPSSIIDLPNWLDKFDQQSSQKPNSYINKKDSAEIFKNDHTYSFSHSQKTFKKRTLKKKLLSKLKKMKLEEKKMKKNSPDLKLENLTTTHRQNHNKIERQRRQNLTNLFIDLKHELLANNNEKAVCSGIASQSQVNISKVEILRQSTLYCKNFAYTETLRRELIKKNKILKNKLKHLRATCINN